MMTIYSLFLLLFIYNCECKCDCEKSSKVLEEENRYKDPHFKDGRDSIIQLFGWRFKDVKRECQNFLSHTNYGGIQLSPVREEMIFADGTYGAMYEPVSYEIISRRGNENELKDMITACHDKGLRVYIEVVLNHMGLHGEYGFSGAKVNPNEKSFPKVPYSSEHFHPSCRIENINDTNQYRNCEINGIPDLDHKNEHVRKSIIDFLNKLISFGVAGFRIDAAKFMWPEDLKYIFYKLDNLNENYFEPKSRPFIFLEVVDLGGEVITVFDYNDLGTVTNWFSSKQLDVAFITKGQNLRNLVANYGKKAHSGYLSSKDSMVFIEHHDKNRGHGGSREMVIFERNPLLSIMAKSFMLAHPYGIPCFLSSYVQGTELGSSAPFNDTIYDICKIGYHCEHRIRAINQMNKFRSIVDGTKVTQPWNHPQREIIAFSRENKGFVVFNFERNDQHIAVVTDMNPGSYCDIISGGVDLDFGERCIGRKVEVDQDGVIRTKINGFNERNSFAWDSDEPLPIIAIHSKSALHTNVIVNYDFQNYGMAIHVKVPGYCRPEINVIHWQTPPQIKPQNNWPYRQG